MQLLVGDRLGRLEQQVGRRLEAVLHRHQRVRVLGDRGFADQAGDEMRLRRDLQRVAQAGDLHRDEVLHQLAGALHRVLALHHDVEVEVVDQRDQQVGELLVRAEHLGQAFRLVLARARLEIRELDQVAHLLLQRLELAAGRNLAELLFGAPRRGDEAVLQHRQDAGRGGERAGGQQPGHQIGLGADLDHRLHHLHAALDQRAHRDVAALADVLGGGDDLEIAVVHDRGELVADLAVHLVQRVEARIELVANVGAIGDDRFQRLEIFLQLLRHRLGGGKAVRLALSDAQPVHDRIEIARAGGDLARDLAAVVRGLRRHIARGGGRNLARGDREAQRIGHGRHFAARHALQSRARSRKTT